MRLLCNVGLFFYKDEYKLDSPSMLAPTGQRQTPDTGHQEAEANEGAGQGMRHGGG